MWQFPKKSNKYKYVVVLSMVFFTYTLYPYGMYWAGHFTFVSTKNIWTLSM